MTALDQRAKWPEFGRNARRLVTAEYEFKNVMLMLEQKMIELVDQRAPVKT
jgi:hypothetical protein